MRQLTYRGTDLDELMRRIADEHGIGARVVAVDTERFGGVLGFFQKERHVLVAEVDDVDEVEEFDLWQQASESIGAVPSATVAPHACAELQQEPPAMRSSSDVVDELIASQAKSTEDYFDLASVPRRPKTFAEALNSITSSLGESDLPLPEGVAESSLEWAELAMQAQEHRRVIPGDQADSSLQTRHDQSTDLTMRLRAAGCPARLLAELASYGVEDASLERAFAIVPQPRSLPRSRGGIIAVVGPCERAVELASRVADDLRVDATTLALVTREGSALTDTGHQIRRPAHAMRSRAIDGYLDGRPTEPHSSPLRPGLVATTLEEVSDLSIGWRRDRVGVVAVACDMKVSSFEWVRSVLRALTPSYVSVITRASAKAEDLAVIAELIGGVDSLFIETLDETVTPLSALASGIPVGRLNGDVATAKEWIRVLDSLPDQSR